MALKFPESQKGERAELKRRLSFFAHHLATRARARVGGGASAPAESERWATRHGLVLETIDDIEKNVQPALALEAMLLKMRDR